jgi:DNA-binding MarR family transcriptional regulator
LEQENTDHIQADEPAADSIVELEHFIPYRLSVLSLAISQNIADLYSEQFNFGIMEWRVIAVLGNYQPLSANQICERTNMDKVQVSRTVSSLTSAGLVLRKTDREDRRKSQLRLSANGSRVYRQIVPMALKCEQELLSTLTLEETEEFERILGKLEQKAKSLGSPA